jgi:hypothetical protein
MRTFSIATDDRTAKRRVPAILVTARRLLSFDVLRWVIAGILFGAAMLKAYGLLIGMSEPGRLGSPLLRVIVFEVEMALAAWLIVGSAPRVARWCIFSVFGLFAAVSTYYALLGKPACAACFGPLAVSPWATLALDIAILVALSFSARPGPSRHKQGVQQAAPSRALALAVVLPVVLFSMLFGLGSVVFGSPSKALTWISGNQAILEEETIDLGACELRTHHIVEFVVQNRSDKPLRIVGGTTTCRCVATRGLPVVVPARGSRPVPVEVTVLSADTDFNQSVTMFSDGNVLGVLQGRIVGKVGDAGTPSP